LCIINIVVLAISSFYAESGGQIGDCGTLLNDTVAFVVNNTQRQKSGAFDEPFCVTVSPKTVRSAACSKCVAE
jgi:alanyl-tRNA synthetase